MKNANFWCVALLLLAVTVLITGFNMFESHSRYTESLEWENKMGVEDFYIKSTPALLSMYTDEELKNCYAAWQDRNIFAAVRNGRKNTEWPRLDILCTEICSHLRAEMAYRRLDTYVDFVVYEDEIYYMGKDKDISDRLDMIIARVPCGQKVGVKIKGDVTKGLEMLDKLKELGISYSLL